MLASPLTQTETAVGEVQGALAGLGERLAEVEQKTARRGGGSGSSLEVKSWGQRFVESDEQRWYLVLALFRLFLVIIFWHMKLYVPKMRFKEHCEPPNPCDCGGLVSRFGMRV